MLVLMFVVVQVVMVMFLISMMMTDVGVDVCGGTSCDGDVTNIDDND